MTLFPENKFALSLHSSSPQLGLSLTNFDDIWRTQTWDLERELSNLLHSKLLEFIPPQTWQDLCFLAVDRGPGSFTSTRIAMVTARTLAQQLEIPLFAFSSLEALAWSRRKQERSLSLFATQMNATQGKLYGAVYQALDDRSPLIPLIPDALFTPEAWQSLLSQLPQAYALIEAPRQLGNMAIAILELAYLQWQHGDRPSWSAALPFYG
jgi:tRNA threonylcarbamoyladenosine biosynthesis protein TsaB